MSHERRGHGRAEVELAVSFYLPGSAGAPWHGTARDLSLGGMFIETPLVLPFRTDITISLRVPGSKEPLSLPARVRWGSAGGMGVQFLLLGARETNAIVELCRPAPKLASNG